MDLRKFKQPHGYIIAGIIVMVVAGFFYDRRHQYESEGGSVYADPSSSPQLLTIIDTSHYDAIKKLQEAERLLRDEPLRVENKPITYTEYRNGSPRSFTDVEKEVAVVLLDARTGDLIKTKIVKKGDELVNLDGRFYLDITERTNGVRWNEFNTLFRVVRPPGMLVLKVKYPLVHEITWVNYQRVADTEDVLYSPYIPELHLPDVIAEGTNYLIQADLEARHALQIRKVRSRAFPDKLVTEVIGSDWIRKLPFVEQTDFGEFWIDPRKSFERVAVLLGLNKGEAWQHTRSSANALGWVQFIPSTYSFIRDKYAEAGLIRGFEDGAQDHVNSLMAAYLLYDSNLEFAINRYGEDIVEDPRLEEYLASSYNGGAGRTFSSLSASLQSSWRSDWTGELRAETKGFIAKLRELKESYSYLYK